MREVNEINWKFYFLIIFCVSSENKRILWNKYYGSIRSEFYIILLK